MKKLLFTSFLFCFVLVIFAQNEVAWLKKNIIPLPLDSSTAFTNKFETLKKYIGDAKIVMLGEETHGDGTTFKTKVELIKFLHQNMGFDILVWEGGLFQAEKAWELATQNVNDAVLAFQHSTFPQWAWSKQVQPLFTYVKDVINSNKPLRMTGFDFQLGSRYDINFLAIDLFKYLRQNKISFKSQSDQNCFFNFLGAINQGLNERISVASGGKALVLDTLKKEKVVFVKVLDEKIEQLCKLTDSKGQMFCQILRSVRSYLPVFSEKLGLEKISGVNHNVLRDSIMAENIIWLSETMYPTKKMIVWAANFHIARNNDLENGLPLMADRLNSKLGDKIYSIGFTAHEGTWGTLFMSPKQLLPAKEGSLEYLFNKIGVPNFLIDLKTLSKTDRGQWLNNTVRMRPFGYAEYTKIWPEVFDAIIFNKTMEPATRIGSNK